MRDDFRIATAGTVAQQHTASATRAVDGGDQDVAVRVDGEARHVPQLPFAPRLRVAGIAGEDRQAAGPRVDANDGVGACRRLRSGR